jgi:glycosyltransferase involved in cell wall biosynthesis
MKRVLIFSLAYFPKHVGGAEVSVKEITDRLPDIEFHLIANRFDSGLPKEEKIGNVYVHRIGIATKNPGMADLKRFPLALNKPLYQFLAVWHAVWLHRKYSFDALWAVMAHSTGVPAGLFKMLYPNVRYVLNLQEGDPIEYIEKKMTPVWPLFVQGFARADIVQPLSTFLAAWARARGCTGAIEIIPNAVSVQHFAQVYSQEEKQRVQLTFNKKPEDIVMVTTSRLVTKNAVDDVIRSLVLLPPNVKFVVYGTGPDEATLKMLIADLGVEDRVFLQGHLSHKDMPLVLQSCDIFIRPSRSEGFGASFVEAMAAGVPVIATQEGGIADFLFDEKRNPGIPTTGWAVDKDAPEQIAAAVLDIMGRPEKVRDVVERARRMVSEKYDWDIIAKSMYDKVFLPLFNT